MNPVEMDEVDISVKPAFAEPNILAILVAALVVFITIVFFVYRLAYLILYILKANPVLSFAGRLEVRRTHSCSLV